MGYGQRYRAKCGTTVSQMCIQGLNQLIMDKIIDVDEIGAIIVSTFSPDYFVPHVSNLIHGEFGLSKDILTIDYWDGCAGYVMGIMHSCMLLNHLGDKKVLLFTGDVMNRLPQNGEFEVYDEPRYGGDGASITIIENSDNDLFNVPFVMHTDGKQREMIAHKMGAFYDIFHLNKAHRDKMLEDPASSFRYFQSAVPETVNELLEYTDIDISDIDGFSFIQANGLSGRKYADGLCIPYERVPADLVEKYGDMSATLNAFGIVEILKRAGLSSAGEAKAGYNIMVVGYGSGLKYGAALLNLDKDVHFGIIETDL